jgi:hypothetical protein
METAEIVGQEEIKKEVAPVVYQAQALVIRDATGYAAAGELCKAVKGGIKRVTDFFAPMVKANLEATRTTNEAKRRLLDPLTEAEAVIKRKQLDWYTEQERIRAIEQRRLQAEADAKAERERAALLKKAEAVKTPEKQEAYREQAAMVQAPVVMVATAAPVVKGQSVRKKWRARVVDAAKVPRAWLIVNDPALQAFAANTKGSVPVEGVEFWEDSVLASGRA